MFRTPHVIHERMPPFPLALLGLVDNFKGRFKVAQAVNNVDLYKKVTDKLGTSEQPPLLSRQGRDRRKP